MSNTTNCKYCNESKEEKVVGIKIVYEYENPEAIGYPDIAYWEQWYKTNSCPICGRKIREVKEV